MKKNYLTPSLRVVMIDENDLIATSTENRTVTLSFDLDESYEDGYAD